MISLIVAMDRNGLIGSQGKIPWAIKSELQHFKSVTTGGVCIFGRKTWESLPNKPLYGRINMVISKHMVPHIDPIVFDDLDSALTACRHSFPNKEIFICGGSSLYNETLPFADRIYLSCIYGDYEGDTFFPCKPLNLIYDMDFAVTSEFCTGAVAISEAEAWDFYLLERHIRTF